MAALAGAGLGASEIARRTGIPRSTVRDWCGEAPPRPRPVASCDVCGNAAHHPLMLDREMYAYLLGLYLGDGHIVHVHRGVHQIRISIDARHPRLAASAAAAMVAVHPQSRSAVRGRPGVLVASSYSKSWPCLFPQHGPGRKHDRPIVLRDWQADIVAEHPGQLVRGLLLSDGCRFVNRVTVNGRTYEYGRYNFSNRSGDIHAIFCAGLDALQIPWRRMNAHTIAVSRRAGVAALDAIVERKA